MHVPVLSKVLELAAGLAYWWLLRLLAVLVGGDGETRVLTRGERGRVLTVRVSGPQTAVVVVRSGKGADHVVVAIDMSAAGTTTAGTTEAGTAEVGTARGKRRPEVGR